MNLDFQGNNNENMDFISMLWNTVTYVKVRDELFP